jgi:actin-like ATPase involved in cell morphogenesis
MPRGLAHTSVLRKDGRRKAAAAQMYGNVMRNITRKRPLREGDIQDAKLLSRMKRGV